MSRNVNEWLASGEAKKAKMSENIEVGTTITFGGGSDGAFDGLFTRVDENGNVVGYRAVNQDIEMVASDATNITIADTETLLVELTIDNDVSKENGSWAVACKINNGSSSRDDIVNLIMRDNAGNALSSKSFQIDKGDNGYPIAMWGTFANDFAAGEKFKLYATSGRVSVCAGTLTPTTLKAVEAQAAPVTSYASASNSFGSDITRADIDAVVANPIHLKQYLIEDTDDTLWSCTYLSGKDKYVTVKLNQV